ncbi:MAG TPA: hypothetical protein VLB82_14915 [Thermodesulfobacteriota bacterium]|nr:hypothetical protein [Thermodesulfobacteriota bacterium]
MARKKKKYHYIYKTTCSVTNKFYIGMHSTNKLDDGYIGSGKRLWFSINYHGKENHEVEIIEYCDSREELKKREKEIVNEELLNEYLCMNLVIGGEGGRGFTFEEQKLNAEKSNAKQKILRETDPEWKKRESENMSKGQKKVYEEGRREKFYFYDWTGKKLSEEAKRKIGERNSEQQKGERNSQFGTCWITRDGVNKKIKKQELEIYAQRGWEKGRKLK